MLDSWRLRQDSHSCWSARPPYLFTQGTWQLGTFGKQGRQPASIDEVLLLHISMICCVNCAVLISGWLVVCLEACCMRQHKWCDHFISHHDSAISLHLGHLCAGHTPSLSLSLSQSRLPWYIMYASCCTFSFGMSAKEHFLSASALCLRCCCIMQICYCLLVAVLVAVPAGWRRSASGGQ